MATARGPADGEAAAAKRTSDKAAYEPLRHRLNSELARAQADEVTSDEVYGRPAADERGQDMPTRVERAHDEPIAGGLETDGERRAP